MSAATTQDLGGLKLYELAVVIEEDWAKVNFAAAPYLDAMKCLGSVEDYYGQDDGKGIVLYFLGNARSWTGETAKAVKAELKKRLK